MQAVDLALPTTAQFEGCEKRLHGLVYPYLDKLAKPPRPTRGYGRTYGITMESPPITVDGAKDELRQGLEAYARDVLKLAPVLAMYPHRLGAVVDWAWNCGIGAFRVSRLRRAILEQRWEDAALLILKPDTAGGVVYRGLQRRRAVNAALFRAEG